MRYTRNQIIKAIDQIDRQDADSLENAIAKSCMRAVLKTMPIELEQGDILRRTDENPYNSEYGIFENYTNEARTGLNVICGQRTGNIGNSTWTIDNVEKIGHWPDYDMFIGLFTDGIPAERLIAWTAS